MANETQQVINHTIKSHDEYFAAQKEMIDLRTKKDEAIERWRTAKRRFEAVANEYNTARTSAIRMIVSGDLIPKPE